MKSTLDYYHLNAKTLSTRYESANVKHIHSLLTRIFFPATHLLEIGCGSGRDASFMFNQGYEITAIDGSEEMIKEARRLHPELSNSFFTALLPDNFHYKANSFDGIFSIATLMHLQLNKLDIVFSEIYRVLKPSGRFVFSVSIQRNDIDYSFKDINGRHFTTIPKDHWLQFAKEKGFKLLEANITEDGLDRKGILWLTCVLEK